MKSVKASEADIVRMMKDMGRTQAADFLNSVLSDEYVLHTKTRDYNWTISDAHVSDLHDILYAQFKEIDDILDEVAARARELGGRSLGTLREFLGQARLKDSGENETDAKKLVTSLLEDHETVIRLLKDEQARFEQGGDDSTKEFLRKLVARHEKMAWTLRAFLQFRAGQA
ncbi:MAG: DNA starvation/stationary phase protection protein [Elusimicrobia bacterium]|nr:DNA starvation/stationary phase protection protein [Elusimicrobiota bacterium]